MRLELGKTNNTRTAETQKCLENEVTWTSSLSQVLQSLSSLQDQLSLTCSNSNMKCTFRSQAAEWILLKSFLRPSCFPACSLIIIVTLARLTPQDNDNGYLDISEGTDNVWHPHSGTVDWRDPAGDPQVCFWKASWTTLQWRQQFWNDSAWC